MSSEATAPVTPEAAQVPTTEIQQDEEFQPIVELTESAPAEVAQPAPAQPAQEAAAAAAPATNPTPSPTRKMKRRTARPAATAPAAQPARKKSRKKKPAKVAAKATAKVATSRTKSAGRPSRAASVEPLAKGTSPYQDGSARDIMFRVMVARMSTKEEVCAAAKKACAHPEAVFAANFYPRRKPDTKKLFEVSQHGNKFKIDIIK